MRHIHALFSLRIDLGFLPFNIHFIFQEHEVWELAAIADILIYDLNSTAILEGLMTKKPVFLFSGLDNHDDRALALLKKRAIVTANPDEFISYIELFLKGSLPDSPDSENTEFLRGFGTHENEGRSALRAAAQVREAIDKAD